MSRSNTNNQNQNEIDNNLDYGKLIKQFMEKMNIIAEQRIVSAKETLSEEYAKIFVVEVNSVLKKAKELYLFAKELPTLYTKIVEDHRKDPAGFLEITDKKLARDDKENEKPADLLLRSYRELFEYRTTEKKREYRQKYGGSFSAAIASIAFEADSMIEETIQKILKPQKSVSWKEDKELVDVKKIPSRSRLSDNESKNEGAWVNRVKNKGNNTTRAPQ